MKKYLHPGYIIIIILLLIIAIGSWYFIFRNKTNNSQTSNVSNYSAVFLVNGQVYFGKLGKTSTDYTVLTDIYYLQVDQSIQPATKKTTDQQQISLVKLGDEIHGPKDEMKINKEQILFIEDLKEDGQVVKTIKAYKEGKQSPAL